MRWPWWKSVGPVKGKYKKLDSKRYRKKLKRECNKNIEEYHKDKN